MIKKLFLIFPLVIATHAFTQEADTASEVEEIVVTGSQIKGAKITGALPVTVITSADIEGIGVESGDELFAELAEMGSNSFNQTDFSGGYNASRGDVGSLDLRNIGTGNTLTLLNGRRLVQSPGYATEFIGGSYIPVSSVNSNLIPVYGSERIEILRDGAASIYGADAVAGVINVITKKEYDGFSVSASQGEYDAGYGGNNQIDLLFGASSEKASSLFNFSFSSQEGIFGGEIPRAAIPWQGCTNPPGSGTGPENSPTNLGPNNAQNAGFGNFTPDTSIGVCGSSRSAYGRFFTSLGQKSLIPGQAGTDLSHFRPFTAAAMYNYAPINHVQLPVERWGAYNYSSFDISDNVTASVQFTYTQVKATNMIAQVPMTAEPSAGPQWQIPYSADSVFNVFNEEISHWRYRSVPFGPRKNQYDNDIFGVRFTLDGNFDMNENTYFWSVGYQQNDASYDQTGYNYINLANLRNAVGPSYKTADGSYKCGTATSPVFGCTPLNLFGGPDMGLSAGVITANDYQQMVAFYIILFST